MFVALILVLMYQILNHLERKVKTSSCGCLVGEGHKWICVPYLSFGLGFFYFPLLFEEFSNIVLKSEDGKK